MLYALLAVIALIVVDGIYSPDGFSHIRTACRIGAIRSGHTPAAEQSER